MRLSNHHPANSVEIRFFDIQDQDFKEFLIASGHPGLVSKSDKFIGFIGVTFLLTDFEVKKLQRYGFWDHDGHWEGNTELLIEIARRFSHNVKIEEYQAVDGEIEICVSVEPIRSQWRFLKEIYFAGR